MIRWRLAISLVLIPLLLAVFYLDSLSGPRALGLFALISLMALRGAWELVELFRPQLPRLNSGRVLFATEAVLVATWYPHWFGPEVTANQIDLNCPVIAFVLMAMMLMIAAAWRYREPGGHVPLLGTELLIVAYVGLLLAVSVQLRWSAGHAAGYLAIGSLMLIVKGGDIGAYTCGKLLKGPRMAPLLSPKKTWSGGVGGVLSSALCSWLWFTWGTPWFLPGTPAPSAWSVLLFGLALGLAGTWGDLCESLLKRDVERKDSAPLLPGFGGALDLLDSLLFAGPVAVVLWKLLGLPVATP